MIIYRPGDMDIPPVRSSLPMKAYILWEILSVTLTHCTDGVKHR